MNLKSTLNKSVTLLELLISIGLLGFLVLIFSSIDSFSHFHVISADRRSKVQNEVSILLGHISKEAGKAIGSNVISGQDPINYTTPISGDPAIRIYVDSGSKGADGLYLPGDGRWGSSSDRTVAYRFTGAATNPDDSYQVWFYPNYTTNPNNYEIVAHNIAPFNISNDFVRNSANNYFEITITGRWQPAQAKSVDNPEIVMRTRMIMPSVSTH
jgi:hypothetical protein